MMFGGCSSGDNIAWSGFADIPTAGWNTLDGREYKPFDGDSIEPGDYTAVIVMRHNDRFGYTRLWLEMEQADTCGISRVDTLAIDVAGADGRFKGSGSFGLYEIADTLPGHVHVTRGWEASVRHIMRDGEIDGINDIGIVLLRVPK